MPKEVVVDEKPQGDKEVVVELDEKGEPVKPEASPKEPEKKDEPRYVKFDELEKERNRFFYTQRKQQEEIENLRRELEAAKSQTPPPSPQAIDEDDILVQKDWKAAVDKRAARQAEEIYKNLRQSELQQAQMAMRQQQEDTLRENSKRKVMERHPELNDPNNEKTLLFQQIVSENPHFLSNPLGPEITMREMEERLRQQGKLVDEPTKNIVEKEISRRARTSGAAVPPGAVRGNQKYVLSKDDKEYCDINGIKYESYARMKNMMEREGGVEAQ